MTWREVEPDENFPLRKFESKPTGRWEYGLTPMLFGVRVRLGLKGDLGLILDYCCGDEASASLWLGFIMALLWKLPEDTTHQSLALLFPRQRVKPIALDKECIAELYHLRDELYKQPAITRGNAH